MITLDFETEAIESWPNFPPKPVGLAILDDEGGEARYLSWGHPGAGNNSTYTEVLRILKSVWAQELLFHHAAFDIQVAMKYFGLPFPPNVHDTQFLLFLDNPHTNLSLKPSADRLLGMAPTEQKELENYIRSHGHNVKEWGAFISTAPASLVAPYAIGDVVRTRAIFDLLYDKYNGAPYQRELKLLPIVVEATMRGIRLDVAGLEEEANKFEKILLVANRVIRHVLNSPDLDVNSPNALADALEAAGKVGQWVLTPKGKRSVSKENLPKAVADPEVLALLRYRGAVETCLSMFARPWLAMGSTTGRLHPSWNQVRGADYGARTGRLSSSEPNFQNVPTEFEGLVIPPGFPDIIHLRDYLLPEDGHVWVKRDYSQQELRILAHFEDGSLLEAYKSNPSLDVHDYAAELIKTYTGHVYKRKATKIVSFTLVYGGGIPALSDKLEAPPHEAALLKTVYLDTFPDVRDLMEEVKARGKRGASVLTTGGRSIFAEESKAAYKLLNHLIQGSAADITKESIVRWHAVKEPGDKFLATVHDENNISADAGTWERSMRRLAEAMYSVELDIPLLSEGFVGKTWGAVEAIDETGEAYAPIKEK